METLKELYEPVDFEVIAFLNADIITNSDGENWTEEEEGGEW